MAFDWPGEKLLVRLLETAEKSCIGLARPWLMRREGKARAAAEYQNKLALGQAETDLEEVKTGRVRYDAAAGRLVPLVKPLPIPPTLTAIPQSEVAPLSLPAPNNETQIPKLGSAFDFATHTLLQSTVKEMGRTINLERILQQAEKESEGVPDDFVADSPVNADWISRWRENAQDVTDEQMQLLWARVLMNEVQKPGQFSLRTLDFLRSVSIEEATLIEKVCQLVIGDFFVFKAEEFLKARDLEFADLLSLQALGILSGVDAGLHWKIEPTHGPKPNGFIYQDMGLRWQKVDKEVRVSCYVMSALGRQLAKLGTHKADLQYVRQLATFLGSKGIRCSLGPVSQIGTSESYQIAEPIGWFGPVDAEIEPMAPNNSPQSQ